MAEVGGEVVCCPNSDQAVASLFGSRVHRPAMPAPSEVGKFEPGRLAVECCRAHRLTG
jgi:hypothetical protein